MENKHQVPDRQENPLIADARRRMAQRTAERQAAFGLDPAPVAPTPTSASLDAADVPTAALAQIKANIAHAKEAKRAAFRERRRQLALIRSAFPGRRLTYEQVAQYMAELNEVAPVVEDVDVPAHVDEPALESFNDQYSQHAA